LSYLILINGELYGVKSKFHIHGCFLFRYWLLTDVDVFAFSILDDRLIIDDLLPLFLLLVEGESCFPSDELPPIRRLRKD